jgi:hydroxymethylpyrimidine/phosphomethylpyrimidine kinase
LGANAVMLKGGHLAGKNVIDRLDTGNALYEFEHPRLKINGHGTGCTLSAAIAANLALKQSLADACELAGDYVFKALQTAYKPGKSNLSVLNHV